MLFSCWVWLFATPWTAACQAALSFTSSWSLFKFMSIELVMPSNHLILFHHLLLPPSIISSISIFKMSQLFTSGGQSIGASASALVLPMNISSWFPLRLTGLISLQSTGSQESYPAPQLPYTVTSLKERLFHHFCHILLDRRNQKVPFPVKEWSLYKGLSHLERSC